VFHLSLNDSNNQIIGHTEIEVDFSKVTDTFSLDLVSQHGRYGMTVTEVLENHRKADYTHRNDKILIRPRPGDSLKRQYSIKYSGVPQKGLVIDTTRYGKRSFFGDNWPNLARHWLPCVDHPYDKASVEFRVTAPEYYDVLATGEKIEESNLGNGLKLTAYREQTPVAMKVVTIGVTRFASKILGRAGGVEVSAWVYPENRLEGFSDFEEATRIMDYYIGHVGPYAYAKLANMQAKTQWGGLENAGTIAYKESIINGKNEIQGLMAHEIAHQWFGDSVTENSWNHVWLSEGFATYFTILYQESVYGDQKRMEELKKDRGEIIEYYHKNPSPVVDYRIQDPKKVLNTNTYQKGGWVLNMLRHRMGDDAFWKGIRSYYSKFRNANVMSSDFREVMEEKSGLELGEFFNQWLYVEGYPEIDWKWSYKKGKLTITVEQLQRHQLFHFPLEFGIVVDGKMKVETVQVMNKRTVFDMSVSSKPRDVLIDPGIWLLYDER
jgi:aminopeptidase N